VDIAAALRAFGAVFPAELPDKTMIATIVLVAHHRRALPVWCGAAAAFTVHVTLAVMAGQVLRTLPSTAVSLATAVLFAVGAVLLWRGATEDTDLGADGDARADRDQPDGDSTSSASTSLAAFAGSFGVVMLAEAGDLTQLATAGLAASSGAPLAVGLGALAALWLVAGLAVVAGRQLTAILPVHQLRRIAAVVFAVLAVVALLSAVR
jgi:putative Ca2+/H+ antiporter (TMEM165/GDT1 family)